MSKILSKWFGVNIKKEENLMLNKYPKPKGVDDEIYYNIVNGEDSDYYFVEKIPVEIPKTKHSDYCNVIAEYIQLSGNKKFKMNEKSRGCAARLNTRGYVEHDCCYVDFYVDREFQKG